ncbi:MAG: copper oxidase, partial [Hydrogenophaga sp.]
GADHRGLVKPLQRAAPDYMVMGERGMADMGEMQMELPANTFPMMTGTGPYGPIEMGGMFTTLKVRADLKAGDYRDPGDYAMPTGTQAREADTGQAPAAQRPAAPTPATPPAASARKPAAGAGHAH